MRVVFLCVPLVVMFMSVVSQAEPQSPNVLLLSVDDLNDWVGVLDGHPQAKTPSIDALAARGVLFRNAHCQAPVCNPSRASMMTSLYPATTGIYFLNPPIRQSRKARQVRTLPKRYAAEGYVTLAAGKIFHASGSRAEFQQYGGDFGGFGPRPKKKLSPFPGHPLWDWGTFPEKNEGMPDYKIAGWAERQLSQSFGKPFFMGVGFYRPHVPQYTPQMWRDMHPLDQVALPEVREDDLDDVPGYALALTRDKHVAPTHDWVVKNEEWKALVQTYLASSTFVDAQVGRVMKALESSAYASNTYVVLFSDHGFHLGEKERWAKRSLWRDGVRVPLIILGPGIPAGKVCDKPVGLIDVYPTLLELTGHDPDVSLEGRSLVPLLKDVEAEWPHLARSSFGPGNVSLVSEHFRYIHYKDGSEEFYDNRKDPNEWVNQIKNPEYADEVDALRARLPKSYHPVLGGGSTGHKAFAAAEQVSK